MHLHVINIRKWECLEFSPFYRVDFSNLVVKFRRSRLSLMWITMLHHPTDHMHFNHFHLVPFIRYSDAPSALLPQGLHYKMVCTWVTVYSFLDTLT